MKRNFIMAIAVLTHFTALAQWEITSGPASPNVISIAANDTLMIAACTENGVTTGGFATTDNGDSWSLTGINLTQDFYVVVFHPITGTIYVGATGSFYQSVDGGLSYTNTNNGLTGLMVRDILIDGDNLIVSNQGIHVSSNGGFNWNLISPSFASYKLDKQGNRMLAGSFSAGVHYSNDNGTTWMNFTEGLPSTIVDVIIFDSSLLIATNFGIYVSEDEGLTWIQSDYTEPVSCFYKIGTTLFAGTNAGVFVSTDSGYTWESQNDGLSNLNTFSMASNNEYLFAGTTGYVFRRPLSDLDVLNTRITTYPTEPLIAPNPGIEAVKIQFANDLTGKKLSVINLNGALVEELFLSGSNITLDISAYSSGVYFIHVESVPGTQRFVKQ
jgi:photosystem II stability/assembly factor-like uncharacterized protein